MNAVDRFDAANPICSIIIPAYNVAEVLSRSVESALAQSLQNIEVIIVDDASQDSTAETALSLARQDNRIRLLRSQTNRGPGAARSLGLRKARGHWIAVLDADDWYAETRLAKLISTAEEQSVDMIADNLVLVDPATNEVVGRSLPMKSNDQYRVTVTRMLQHTVPAGRINLGWCKPVFSADFLREHAIEWREFRHAEDFLMDMEVLLAGGTFILVGEASYYYTQRFGTRSGSVSQHSRTARSVDEQQAVIDDLLKRYSAAIDDCLLSGLLRMRSQIEVAGYLLDVRDAVIAKRFGHALMPIGKALLNPVILFGCLLAR
ncbi:MAG: hypothetical protein Cons2KO_10450 [Congregibacter sp.]